MSLSEKTGKAFNPKPITLSRESTRYDTLGIP